MASDEQQNVPKGCGFYSGYDFAPADAVLDAVLDVDAVSGIGGGPVREALVDDPSEDEELVHETPPAAVQVPVGGDVLEEDTVCIANPGDNVSHDSKDKPFC